MNSAERFLTSLQGGVPDRVPIFELFINPKIIDALTPGATLADFVEIMDLDAISSLWMTDGTIQETRINESTTEDEWGITWGYGAEGRAPIGGPINTIDDARRYVPPDPDAPYRLDTFRTYVDRFKGKKAVIYQSRYGFMWAADLLRLDVFLINLIKNPKLVHEVLDIANDFAIKLAVNAVRAGADVIAFGDDVAFNTGLMMSPSTFEEFLLPRFEKAVAAVQAEGALCIKHSDGNIWKIMDMIVDSGVDGINPLEPIADMDIGRVKQIYGDRICLLGNIDCGSLLCDGTAEEVEKTVKETIRVAAPGGGYIMSSSNSIHSAVNPENYRAMIEATKKYGKYPITIS